MNFLSSCLSLLSPEMTVCTTPQCSFSTGDEHSAPRMADKYSTDRDASPASNSLSDQEPTCVRANILHFIDSSEAHTECQEFKHTHTLLILSLLFQLHYCHRGLSCFSSTKSNRREVLANCTTEFSLPPPPLFMHCTYRPTTIASYFPLPP